MSEKEFVLWSVLVLHWLICGFLAKRTAVTKGYAAGFGFWTGFFFGPLGLLAVVGMADLILRKQILNLAKTMALRDSQQKEQG